jgi:hypothetical protein
MQQHWRATFILLIFLEGQRNRGGRKSMCDGQLCLLDIPAQYTVNVRLMTIVRYLFFVIEYTRFFSFQFCFLLYKLSYQSFLFSRL